MMRKSKTQKVLEAAGFMVNQVYPGARWFDVVAPDGSKGLVLCQSFAAWHFFFSDFVGTASSCNVAKCHLGGLGDALNTESQIKTYKKLLLDSHMPREIMKNNSVFAAISQAYND